VPFIDCSGLAALCRARNRVTTRDGRLRLISRSPGFLRILRHAGLWDVFELHSGLSGALAAAVSPPDAVPAVVG